MKKKILFSLLFIFAFIILININTEVSAFVFKGCNTVDYGYIYDTDFMGDINLYEYTFVNLDELNNCYQLVTSTIPFTLRVNSSDNSKYDIWFFSSEKQQISYAIYYIYFNENLDDVNINYKFLHGNVNLSVNKLNCGNSFSKLVYSNYILKNTDTNDIIFKKYENEITYLNFKYNDLVYSIYGFDFYLEDYIAVFKSGNYALVYTSETMPGYKYENYTHYMLDTGGYPKGYIFDFSTSELTPLNSITEPFGFDPEQLIYSNFDLNYYHDNQIEHIFERTGDKVGVPDGDIGEQATGNYIAAGSPSGNTYLDDYISDKLDEDEKNSNIVTNGFNGVYSKFGFVDGVKSNVNGMVDVITNTSEAPKFQININSKYYKGTLTIVDLSWYEPYKEYGDAVICTFIYLSFLWNVFCKLPDIIRGAGASTYVGDMDYEINQWADYGLLRSNSPSEISQRRNAMSSHIYQPKDVISYPHKRGQTYSQLRASKKIRKNWK